MRNLLPGDPSVDALTGALSRHHFDQLLGRAVELATAAGDAVALLVIDIDHFKTL
jgi:two-component system, cell cycle response regulator